MTEFCFPSFAGGTIRRFSAKVCKELRRTKGFDHICKYAESESQAAAHGENLRAEARDGKLKRKIIDLSNEK